MDARTNNALFLFFFFSFVFFWTKTMWAWSRVNEANEEEK
jgi:hypothetical protein